MPAIRLPAPDASLSKLPVEKQVQALTDLVMRFRRELEYLLNGNLDEDNGVIKAEVAYIEQIFAEYITTNVLESNTIITNNLTAQKGYIADLTVDKLDTSDMVRRYLLPSTDPLRKAPVKYQRIFDEVHEKRVATYAGDVSGEDNEVQVTDYYGNLIYWLDEEHIGTGITYDETDYPCMRLVYDGPDGMGQIKKIEYFAEVGGEYVPATQHGLGNGVGDNGKMFEMKGLTGYEQTYIATGTGDVAAAGEVKLILGNDGVRTSSPGAVAAVRNTAVVADATEAAAILDDLNDGDLVVMTQAFQTFTTTGTINRLGSHSVRFTGSSASDINMPASPVVGDFFVVKNRGTATATLKGTFDAATDLAVAAGDAAKVQYNGTDWDVM